MIDASYNGTTYNQSTLAKELDVSRQTVRNLIQDCLGEGYIKATKNTSDAFVKNYEATKGMREAFENSCRELFNLKRF